ncbi:MAG: hypothetical protein CG445_329 [Methanosaeta sp. ASM2]|nr:MAG: hypothetical protein CG445_329 [Methanosaeta sp. ASM2]
MHGNLLCLPAAYKALPSSHAIRSCFQDHDLRDLGLAFFGNIKPNGSVTTLYQHF